MGVMKLTATHGIPAAQNGCQGASGDLSASYATRYLSAAAHLRRPMLPDEITELGWPVARPPLPVGRSYARRVLFTAEGVIPMSAVDMGEVRKHCRIALLQTVIRDVLAIGILVASAMLEPWGTTVTFGLVTAFIILVGRVRLFSPLIIAVAIGATLAVVTGTPNERISFAVPLVSLAACLLIYLADILLSIHYVRKIWRRASLPSLKPHGTARRRLISLNRSGFLRSGY
jgi:hypothetical protein